MSDRSEIRGTWKQVLAGKLVSLLMRALGLTLRYEIIDPTNQMEKSKPGVPVIWIFWHNCLFAATITKKRFSGNAPASALASASRDGAVIESTVAGFGVKTIRGSSSRRGVAALIALKKALKAGEQLFITPDGPRGPRYQLQPGAVKLAQSTGAPIIPVRFEYHSSWRLKSWDRFHIPKPFSKITVRVDDAIHVPAKLDEDGFENYRNKIEFALRGRGKDISNKN